MQELVEKVKAGREKLAVPIAALFEFDDRMDANKIQERLVTNPVLTKLDRLHGKGRNNSPREAESQKVPILRDQRRNFHCNLTNHVLDHRALSRVPVMTTL